MIKFNFIKNNEYSRKNNYLLNNYFLNNLEFDDIYVINNNIREINIDQNNNEVDNNNKKIEELLIFILMVIPCVIAIYFMFYVFCIFFK